MTAGARLAALVGVVAALGGVTAALAIGAPFCDVLGAYTTDVGARSPEQRRNIAEAARRLAGVEIEPGATFSFNQTVGPRTAARGFVAAPAFLEGARLSSVGGGICQVSSTLYDAALAADVPIAARVPHDRLVTSVPPGADATVWYGKADLAFGNSTGAPIRLTAAIVGDRLTVTLRGTRRGAPVAITREPAPPPRIGTIRVRTWRIAGADRRLLADDVYRR